MSERTEVKESVVHRVVNEAQDDFSVRTLGFSSTSQLALIS